MKQIFKKNQIIITTLAVMIAIAGYLNYSGKLFGETKSGTEETNADMANKELLDISEDDLGNNEIASNDSDVEGTPGEAVLTSGSMHRLKYHANKCVRKIKRCCSRSLTVLQSVKKKNKVQLHRC